MSQLFKNCLWLWIIIRTYPWALNIPKTILLETLIWVSINMETNFSSCGKDMKEMKIRQFSTVWHFKLNLFWSWIIKKLTFYMNELALARPIIWRASWSYRSFNKGNEFLSRRRDTKELEVWISLTFIFISYNCGACSGPYRISMGLRMRLKSDQIYAKII